MRRAKPSQDGCTLFEAYASFLDAHCTEAHVDDIVVGWDVHPVCDAGRVGEEAAQKRKESFQWHARGG
jgi:hypothetical protein